MSPRGGTFLFSRDGMGRSIGPGVVLAGLVGLALVEQNVIDLLGSDHIRLAGLFVEYGVIQRIVFVEDGYLAEGVLADVDLRIVPGVGGTIGLDLIDYIFELDGEIFGDGARLLPGEDLVKILMGQQGSMSIQGSARLDRKAGVEVKDELGQIRIALLHRGDAEQAHLPDQAVLQGLVDTLEPPFCLRGIGTQDWDFQALHGSSKLGQVVSGDRMGDIDPKNAMFIRVEPGRPAMGCQILPQQVAVAEETLLRHKRQGPQLPRGIMTSSVQRSERPSNQS